MNKENNDHYVYVHRRKDNNVVFYVGHGRGSRIYSKHNRSVKWNEVINTYDWEYSILKGGLTKVEAEELEMLIINIYDPMANVQRQSTSIKSILADSDYIRQRYTYDESSISCIKYISGNNQHGKKKRIAGDDAGTYNKISNTFTVSVNYRNRLSHRVVWFLCTGEDPIGYLIDHIDGNSSNNKISNLRKVMHKDNNQNVKLKSNNSSGYKGVRLHNNTNNSYYEAYASNGVKKISKFFSIDKYGKDLALALAVECRFRIINDLNSNGANYTNRHVGDYKILPILDQYSEYEIDKMLTDSLSASNKSGFSNLSYCESSQLWTVKYKDYCRYFSELKFGKNLAKSLAVEFLNRIKYSIESNVQGYDVEQTSKMIENSSIRPNNTSGTKGISFVYKDGNVSQAVAQKIINGKSYSKRISVKKHGMDKSLNVLKDWLDCINKLEE